MVPDRTVVIERLRAQLNRLAAGLGNDASQIAETDIIPDTEVLDSAGLFELVIWYDEQYGIDLQPEEMTVDNLGSLARMADFALARMAR